jgi:chondroitin 4-sulfotransferase 11
MISDRYRFIFVHINKTGGTSIEKVFEPDADAQDVRYKHASLAYYRKRFPWKSRRYFTFGFVRNPWDWLVSRFHWSRDQQKLFDYDFDEMLRRLAAREPLARSEPWLEKEALLPQCARLSVHDAIAVDFVGRYERLQHDFDVVCARIGHPLAALPHVFATERAAYPDYYDDRTRAIVERLYARDIAAFEYRFGD